MVSIAVFLKGGPRAGIEVREVVKQAGGWTTIRFYYLAFGLSRCEAEDYVDRPQPLAAALAALMRSRSWDRVEKRLRCLKAISRAEDLDVSRRYVLARIVYTYVELSEDEEERFTAELERESNKEVHEMVVTWEQALEASPQIVVTDTSSGPRLRRRVGLRRKGRAGWFVAGDRKSLIQRHIEPTIRRRMPASFHPGERVSDLTAFAELTAFAFK